MTTEKTLEDFGTVIQSLKMTTTIDGTSRIEVRACGVTLERVVIGSELARGGIASVVSTMASEAEKTAQNLYTAGIAIVPEAVEVLMSHAEVRAI